MRIVVTSSGADLDAPVSPIFGRCQVYVFVDTETMTYEAVENPAIGAGSGAGIRAAQFVVGHGAQALVTGNVGPNAFRVFQSAGVPIYLFAGGTVRQAAEAFRTGQLQSVADATAQAGLGLRPATGRGAGPRPGSDVQPGIGRGMGRGMGMARGTGARTSTPPKTSAPRTRPTRSEEIAALKETAQQLQDQLAQVMNRLEKLQEEA